MLLEPLVPENKAAAFPIQDLQLVTLAVAEDKELRSEGAQTELLLYEDGTKEVELLRKFLTSSSKLMSRKRAGTTTQEQKALKMALKRARFMALLPYQGT